MIRSFHLCLCFFSMVSAHYPMSHFDRCWSYDLILSGTPAYPCALCWYFAKTGLVSPRTFAPHSTVFRPAKRFGADRNRNHKAHAP